MALIHWFRNQLFIILFLPLLLSCTERSGYNCVSCHTKLHTELVADFKSSKMSAHFSCEKCHGIKHQSENDVSEVFLPVTNTCGECHEKKEEQYLNGKHAVAFKSIEILPFTHNQPDALIKGRKGCGGCHSAGYTTKADRFTKNGIKPKYGMGCINCHTRHKFSKSEALEPESCKTCHMGFDHAQFEMWSGSKHGTIYLSDRARGAASDRAPKCQTCHMHQGNHDVITSWGFFGVRGFEDNKEWQKYRSKILQAMGLYDSKGNKTDLYQKALDIKMFREERDKFDKIRNPMVERCQRCHSKSFVKENFDNAEKLLFETDKILASSIEKIEKKEGRIPQLFQFYDVDNVSREILFEMFMDHRMKSFQAGFHINPDYSTWYGYGQLRRDMIKLDHSLKTRK